MKPKTLKGSTLVTTAFITIFVGVVLFILVSILAGTSVLRVNFAVEAQNQAMQ